MIRSIPPIAILAALALLSACDKPEPPRMPSARPTVTATAPYATAPLLLTDEGLGAIRIGQTLGEVQAAAGAPETAIADPDACNIFHPSRAPVGVRVMTEMGRVTRITVGEGVAIRTAQGFGVGSDGAAIKTALGGGVIVQPAKYDPAPAEDLFVWSRGGSTNYVTDPDARGVRYEVGVDGKVRAVHVGGPSIQLAESCG